MVRPIKQMLTRRTLVGRDLDYLDRSSNGVDEKESARNFIQSVEDFVYCKAQERAFTRKRLGVPACIEKHEDINTRQPENGEWLVRMGCG